MRNLPYKVGDVVFMTRIITSKGKGKQGTVTKITNKFTHLTTGYCLHKYIAVLPITEPTEPAESAEPTNQEELIRNLAKLVIKLTEKVTSLENEITCLKTEVRETIFTI